MRNWRTLNSRAAIGAAGMAFCCSAALAGGNQGTVCPQPVGPNIIVGDIPTTTFNTTSQQINGVWYDAFSFGTTSCNTGNANVLWQAFPSNEHPAISQNLYKLKDGRFEQIGMSWLKHGFTALTGNVCGCTCNGNGGSVLGVGCSDPYGASLNAGQSSAGPRWQVNAHTGFFPMGGPANPTWSGSVARRLRVAHADLEPSSATVLYFAETYYVSKHECSVGNQNDSASYRRVNITQTSTNPPEWSTSISAANLTQRERAGIRAWKAHDPTVVETDIQLPNEGLFILAAKVTDIGNGMWHYEYALENLNSDASGYSFMVPMPAADQLVVTNVGFHDVDYHSGDAMNNFSNGSLNFDGTDWLPVSDGAKVQWTCPQTVAENVNANALRWQTTYNFRFDANLPPMTGPITLGTFKVPGSHQAMTLVPGPDCNGNNQADQLDIANGTSEDANGNGIPDECEQPCPDVNSDGQVDVTDLLAVINAWGSPDGPADVNNDGDVNVSDLLIVINAWGACP